MLIQFNFSNFKSYRDPVSFDMTATSMKEHPENVFANSQKDKFVKVAAIYGANASGKTGVIDAFAFMQYLVLFSFRRNSDGKGIPLKRFAFDKSSRASKSEFEVFFAHNGKEYQYGFQIDNKKVYEEWLYKRDFRGKNKYTTLFERNMDKVQCSKSLGDADKLANLVEESTLFLSLIAQARISEAKNVYDWFRSTNVMDFGDAFYEELIARTLPMKRFNDENHLIDLEGFLKAIDIGIDGIRIEESKDTVNEEGQPSYKIYAKHKAWDGSGYVELPFQEESSGTKKMLALHSYLIDCLKQGSTLLVDELDAKLHPLLLRYVINMFHNPAINKYNAQLIYTTHDMYTLTKDTFRRDQIWFVEKDERGISNLFSLVEYKLENKKVRNDATFNKDYLLGRYGAIPLLKEFSIDWE